MRLVTIGLAVLLLAVPTMASAHSGYLHLAKGERSASRYLLRDVRADDASGYRIYDCHRHANREIVCSGDEYDYSASPIELDGQPPDALGLEMIVTLQPRGWVTVREPDSQAAFRTR